MDPFVQLAVSFSLLSDMDATGTDLVRWQDSSPTLNLTLIPGVKVHVRIAHGMGIAIGSTIEFEAPNATELAFSGAFCSFCLQDRQACALSEVTIIPDSAPVQAFCAATYPGIAAQDLQD